MTRPIIDFHCDALSKLQLDPKLDFSKDRRLDVNLRRLKEGGVKLQTFAIFLSQRLGPPKMEHILEQIDVYQERVQPMGVLPVQSVEDLDALERGEAIGGLLSLEGADGLEGNLHYVRVCYEKGVRFLGLTWNYANWAADGVMEPRNGGFTPAGLELVNLCHELGIILDVSHLSVKGFWELQELAESAGKPFIASHSNAYQVCPHARNLRDDLIQAIIKLGGLIGVTTVPWFVKEGRSASSKDLLPHIERICSLGGSSNLMFGSDFDGIESHLTDFRHSGHYTVWQDTLLKYYPEELVRGWLYDNAAAFLRAWLPSHK